MAQQMSSNKLNVQCTYPDCTKYFETEKEMKRHKLDEPEHNYCKKCDVDCKDWEHLTQHKVEAMLPWLDGRMKHNHDESPMHIVCEFCGIDFKSFGGRKKHRETNHRADQNVTCPGCGDVFTRAGNYVAHLEDGKCKSITKKDFQGSIQQKHVVNEIMKNPEEFIQGLRMNKTLTPTSDKPGLIVDGSETQETEEGGVPLLDQEDEAQKGGYKPLQAEVNLIDMNIPYTRSNVETWPRLPGQQPSQLTSSMHSLSLNSRTPSINGSEVSASEYASEITSRRGGTKVYTESYPSLNSPRIPASLNGDDDTASVATSTVGSSTNRPMAWTTAKTSQALFKDAKPTPPAGDWTAVWNYRQQEAAANDSTNLFRSRLWDPDSKEYDVELFFNSMIEKYRCPFPECDGTYYDEPSDIEGHLRVTHLKTSYRCPLCLKIFRSANALVSHSEAGGKCKVKKSSMYDKLLDEISGGYLKAQHLIEPKVYKPGDALVKAGQRVDGVMDTRFTAKLPGEK